MKQTKGTPVSGERLVKTTKRFAKHMQKAKEEFNRMQDQAIEDAKKLRIR
jgi:hypothetical protein